MKNLKGNFRGLARGLLMPGRNISSQGIGQRIERAIRDGQCAKMAKRPRPLLDRRSPKLIVTSGTIHDIIEM